MGKWKWMAAGLVMAAAIPAAVAYDDHDKQLNLELQGGGSLGGGVEAFLKESLKYGDDMSEFYEQETLVMLAWKATGWLKLGVGYDEVQTRKNKARYEEVEGEGAPEYEEANDHYWARESRPLVEATLSTSSKGWKISDRNRFEWRSKENQDAYLRYRNRLKVVAPWQWTSWNIAPYASGEINYEDNDALEPSDRLNRTRWTAGLQMKPMKNLQVSPALFYEFNKKNGEWTDLVTLLLGASLMF